MKFREFFLAVLFVWACATGAQASTLELREATAAITIDDTTTQYVVTLPYHWDRLHGGQSGSGVFDVAFSLPEQPAIPFAVYFLRLGNAYEVWLNGVRLERSGDLNKFNGADYAKEPRYLTIPPQLLQKDNLFRIHIRADVGRRGGVPRLLVGPDQEVAQVYDAEYRWRSMGSLVVAILNLLIGLVALALWATQVDAMMYGQPRRDPLYLFAGLAELCWTVSVSDAIIENPPVPWPWWGVIVIVAAAVWACCMILFCVEVAGWSKLPVVTWLRRWVALLLAVSAAAAMGALVYGHPVALTLWYAALGFTFLIFAPLLIWKAAHGASLSHKIVAVAVLLNTLVGLRDLYVFRIGQVYGGNTLLRYSSVLFGLTLGYIVIMRFRAASSQVRYLTANLAARVAQKERELEQSYQRVEQLAREQERTAERARILRDMHDGVGSHISVAIRQLQSGKASHDEVIRTLRDSLDQLKLSIDAMSLPPGDITALLANLRYRLEPRLLASDIELTWDVDPLDPVGRFDDDGMRQLQFMVFEAISNVLQHAQASVLQIRAKRVGAGVQLRIIDNGRGFDAQTSNRNGLFSMKERAVAIGAALAITSEPGQTVVEIGLA